MAEQLSQKLEVVAMLKKIDYLIGGPKIYNNSDIPFSKDVIKFLSNFSIQLNKENRYLKFADISSLVFWCREKNLIRLKKKYNQKNKIGLGTIFHITPSNVPTNFCYSLIFGLLTGNTNIVKVPSQKFDQIKIICDALKKTIKINPRFNNQIKIIRYESEEDQITNYFSKRCAVRIIWGGDKTIKKVRKFELKPRSKDITFSNRYSISLINLDKINNPKNKNEIKILIKNFYNDTFLNDQNACTTPHLIIWLGKRKKLIDIFWNELLNFVKKNYEHQSINFFEKYTMLLNHILRLDNIGKFTNYENLIYRLKLKNINNLNHLNIGKWGLFFEFNSKNLKILNTFINENYQTITYYGFPKKKILDHILVNKLRGVDRIVPIGQSMNMDDLFWDGHDLFSALTREIKVI